MMANPIFVDKLLNRLERVDKQALQNYLVRLQEEKDQYESLLNQLPVGILLLNEAHRIMGANDAAQSILGTRIERNSNLETVVMDPEFRKWLEEELKSERGIFSEEREILFPQNRHLIVTLRPQHLIVLIDITSIRKKDREESEIQRINALIKLAKGIAHELGNPLNSITIHLKLADKMGDALPAKDKKKFKETMQVLEQETARLDRIIKNFLKATRQKPPEFKVGNIQDLLEEALNFFELEFKESKIKVKTEFARNVPNFLFDRDKLYQAFLNIIKNAVEAMPKGGELWIKIAAREKVCTIAFQDTGVGIPEKDLPYIFEEYYTTKEEGSGLGLAIVYNIIREHGGRMDVKSSPKKGTLFVLQLPIRMEKLQLPMRTNHNG